jgi:uncharacterized protein YecT (DUF1311 family)
MYVLIRADDVTNRDAARTKTVVLLKRAWTSALRGNGEDDKALKSSKQGSAKVDQDLNSAYGKLKGALGDEQKQLLKEAQRSWLAWRDAEIKFASAVGLGSSSAGLLDSVAEDRTKQLLAWFQEATEKPEADEDASE